MCPKSPAWCSDSVSYTHLDVYKRQAEVRALALENGFGNARKRDKMCIRDRQGAVVTVLLTGFRDGPEPSVETELSLAQFGDVPGGKAAFIGGHYNREPDVYKRQA